VVSIVHICKASRPNFFVIAYTPARGFALDCRKLQSCLR
jgi:hypothetical protein